MDELLEEIRGCRICADHLEAGVRPIVQASPTARILIAGQAPGRRVHESGVPFDDPSGERLREWMGVTRDEFYDPRRIAIVPMGFCFPGTGESGDLPPRPECAETWRERLLAELTRVELTLVIGKYAMQWHLGSGSASVTATVKDWRSHGPDRIALPHPSPRNNIWLRRNPWFEDEVLPRLRQRVGQALESSGR
ncbi:MAG: uracil-DNA glycosylase family protein [Planctomycetota bacterium]